MENSSYTRWRKARNGSAMRFTSLIGPVPMAHGSSARLTLEASVTPPAENRKTFRGCGNTSDSGHT